MTWNPLQANGNRTARRKVSVFRVGPAMLSRS